MAHEAQQEGQEKAKPLTLEEAKTKLQEAGKNDAMRFDDAFGEFEIDSGNITAFLKEIDALGKDRYERKAKAKLDSTTPQAAALYLREPDRMRANPDFITPGIETENGKKIKLVGRVMDQVINGMVSKVNDPAEIESVIDANIPGSGKGVMERVIMVAFLSPDRPGYPNPVQKTEYVKSERGQAYLAKLYTDERVYRYLKPVSVIGNMTDQKVLKTALENAMVDLSPTGHGDHDVLQILDKVTDQSLLKATLGDVMATILRDPANMKSRMERQKGTFLKLVERVSDKKAQRQVAEGMRKAAAKAGKEFPINDVTEVVLAAFRKMDGISQQFFLKTEYGPDVIFNTGMIEKMKVSGAEEETLLRDVAGYVYNWQQESSIRPYKEEMGTYLVILGNKIGEYKNSKKDEKKKEKDEKKKK